MRLGLAPAIRKHARTLGDAQTTYKENVVAVNTLITSVLSSALPPLNTYPPDWQDFTTAFEQAGADALDWVNNIMARLLDVPNEVVGYNTIISQLLQDANQQATTLVQNPSNQQALEQLKQDLTGISNQLSLVTTFISSTVTNIQQFQSKLPDIATQLQTIAQKSIQDANADQAAITKLNNDIDQLRDDIKSLTTQLVALGLADGVALTLGVVATIAAWPWGLAAWLVMGPVVAVTTTEIALDSIKIQNDKQQIQSDQQQIQGISADVSTLQVLANNFSAMANQAQEVQSNLQAVLTEWQTLESDVNAAITEIRTAVSDTSNANFSAVANDVNAAISEWNTTYTQAGTLQITLQVNNAQLQLGMSSDQVQAALAGGQTVDIIQYYNSLSSPKFQSTKNR